MLVNQMKQKKDVHQGTLALMVLKTLEVLGPLHGYGVARRIEQLDLPTYPIDPADAFVCVHEDAKGNPRVAFVMNPTTSDLDTRVAIPGALTLVDLLPSGDAAAVVPLTRAAGAFEVRVPSRTVRMFRIGV